MLAIYKEKNLKLCCCQTKQVVTGTTIRQNSINKIPMNSTLVRWVIQSGLADTVALCVFSIMVEANAMFMNN